MPDKMLGAGLHRRARVSKKTADKSHPGHCNVGHGSSLLRGHICGKAVIRIRAGGFDLAR